MGQSFQNLFMSSFSHERHADVNETLNLTSTYLDDLLNVYNDYVKEVVDKINTFKK